MWRTKEEKLELEFCYKYLEDREAYHHHKEYMAYLGLGFQLAFFAGFVAVENCKVEEWKKLIKDGLNCESEYVLAGIVFLIWLLLHLFVRWQLIMRRDAAFHVLVLRDLILDKIKNKEWNRTGGEGKKYCCIRSGFNYLFPFIRVPEFKRGKNGKIGELDKFPSWYQSKFDEECKSDPPQIMSEYIIAFGSIFMLVLMLAKIEVVPLSFKVVVILLGIVVFLSILNCLFCCGDKRNQEKEQGS